MLAENLAELPGLALSTALDALFIKERHRIEQPAGLFFGRLPMNADILSAERAALALRGVPDIVAFIAGDKLVLDSILRLDGLHDFAWGYFDSTSFPYLSHNRNLGSIFYFKIKMMH
jgi:hypothetical protein